MNHTLSGPWRNPSILPGKCDYEWRCEVCGLMAIRRGKEYGPAPILPYAFNEIDCDAELIEGVLRA